jgi:hypothetical protein
MKWTYTSHDGRLSFEFDADSQKAIFAKLGMLQEVFEVDSFCGCCGKTNLRFRVRHAESRDGRKCDYYELQCGDCNARLCFGQHQVGNTLFAKRKDSEGNVLASRGWSVYQSTASMRTIRRTPTDAPAPGRRRHNAAGRRNRRFLLPRSPRNWSAVSRA